jgi:Flp pilus assembly protein TadG
VWTVEAALVLPVLLLVLFGIFEYARFVFTVQLLNNAAREGARYAVVNLNNATTAQVQAYVDNYLVGQGVQLANYSATSNISIFQADPVTGKDNSGGWQNAGFGKPVGVQITGTYTPLLGKMLFMGNSISLTATCIMYSEAN